MKIDYHTIYNDVDYLQYGCDDEYLENCALHWYGLYPQWIRICTFRLPFRRNCLWHTWIWFVPSMDTKVTLEGVEIISSSVDDHQR